MKKLLLFTFLANLAMACVNPFYIITIFFVPLIFVLFSTIYLYIIRDKTTFSLIHKISIFVISLPAIAFGFILLVPLFFGLKYRYKQATQIKTYILALISTLLILAFIFISMVLKLW